ncbi:hypothetical protein BGW38_003038 [Lunasporangiospora selenospora]|uniref:HAUS augmin-like complex subunit 6 N-terminal domain-containing protein n=1 Tax=Lunasporangiospora selenospora TaxID=979761 RepID=A0A9P6FR71_9FUNG|nr:hypothetical protein BGW38_003038 [Lunasporangiospora selenospora]
MTSSFNYLVAKRYSNNSGSGSPASESSSSRFTPSCLYSPETIRSILFANLILLGVEAYSSRDQEDLGATSHFDLALLLLSTTTTGGNNLRNGDRNRGTVDSSITDDQQLQHVIIIDTIGYGTVATGHHGSSSSSKPLELHRHVFARGHQSTKALEFVLWFLFTRLDTSLAKERFKGCWPILDRHDARAFRNVAFKWLEDLRRDGNFHVGHNLSASSSASSSPSIASAEAESPVAWSSTFNPRSSVMSLSAGSNRMSNNSTNNISNNHSINANSNNAGGLGLFLPTIRRSYLDESIGERIEQLVLVLSTYVLSQVVNRELNQDATSSLALGGSNTVTGSEDSINNIAEIRRWIGHAVESAQEEESLLRGIRSKKEEESRICIETMHQQRDMREQWESLRQEMTEKHHSLSESLSHLDSERRKLLMDRTNSHQTATSEMSTKELYSLEDQWIDQTNQGWGPLLSLVEKNVDRRDIFQSMLGSVRSKRNSLEKSHQQKNQNLKESNGESRIDFVTVLKAWKPPLKTNEQSLQGLSSLLSEKRPCLPEEPSLSKERLQARLDDASRRMDRLRREQAIQRIPYNRLLPTIMQEGYIGSSAPTHHPVSCPETTKHCAIQLELQIMATIAGEQKRGLPTQARVQNLRKQILESMGQGDDHQQKPVKSLFSNQSKQEPRWANGKPTLEDLVVTTQKVDQAKSPLYDPVFDEVVSLLESNSPSTQAPPLETPKRSTPADRTILSPELVARDHPSSSLKSPLLAKSLLHSRLGQSRKRRQSFELPRVAAPPAPEETKNNHQEDHPEEEFVQQKELLNVFSVNHGLGPGTPSKRRRVDSIGSSLFGRRTSFGLTSPDITSKSGSSLFSPPRPDNSDFGSKGKRAQPLLTLEDLRAATPKAPKTSSRESLEPKLPIMLLHTPQQKELFGMGNVSAVKFPTLSKDDDASSLLTMSLAREHRISEATRNLFRGESLPRTSLSSSIFERFNLSNGSSGNRVLAKSLSKPDLVGPVSEPDLATSPSTREKRQRASSGLESYTRQNADRSTGGAEVENSKETVSGNAMSMQLSEPEWKPSSRFGSRAVDTRERAPSLGPFCQERAVQSKEKRRADSGASSVQETKFNHDEHGEAGDDVLIKENGSLLAEPLPEPSLGSIKVSVFGRARMSTLSRSTASLSSTLTSRARQSESSLLASQMRTMMQDNTDDEAATEMRALTDLENDGDTREFSPPPVSPIRSQDMDPGMYRSVMMMSTSTLTRAGAREGSEPALLSSLLSRSTREVDHSTGQGRDSAASVRSLVKSKERSRDVEMSDIKKRRSSGSMFASKSPETQRSSSTRVTMAQMEALKGLPELARKSQHLDLPVAYPDEHQLENQEDETILNDALASIFGGSRKRVGLSQQSVVPSKGGTTTDKSSQQDHRHQEAGEDTFRRRLSGSRRELIEVDGIRGGGLFDEGMPDGLDPDEALWENTEMFS